MKLHLSIACLVMFSMLACQQKDQTTPAEDMKPATESPVSPAPARKVVVADAATILARPQVPILCYHQIRNWRAGDSKSARDYIVPVDVFRAQMKLLADSGYHTILPEQLYAYLATGAPLPPKPIMLTYDDTDIDQFEVAAPEMKKYNFKGVFFIMTVSINRRPRYMSREEIKQLSDEGHVIASHTWNHERVPGYKEEKDWTTQIVQPKQKIEEITGKPADYFAYPFGLWNREAIPFLKQHGIKAAFILSTKRDPAEPLFTIRRMIASGHWSAQTTYNSMLKTFAQGK